MLKKAKQIDKKKAVKKPKFLIEANTPIIEIAERFPNIAEYLTDEMGFHCIGCPLVYADTIGEGAVVHGLTEEETKELIGKLNSMTN